MAKVWPTLHSNTSGEHCYCLQFCLLICISDPPRKSIGTTEQLNATIDKDGYIPNTLLIIILITDFFYALVIILQIFFFIKLRRISRPAHFIFEVGAVIFTIAFLTTEPTKWSAGVTALLCSWVSLNLFSRYLRRCFWLVHYHIL